MRASDADRDRYAAVLQQAFVDGRLSQSEYNDRLGLVMEAKTYGELQPLIADLPSDNLPVPRPAADLVPATPSGPPMVAVFSGVERKGVWALPEDNYAVAVFGSVEIDLREAQIAATENEIRAFAILGSVEIIVPKGMRVDLNGIGILGEFSRSKATASPDPNAPLIRVSGLAFLGSVTVKEKD